MNIVQNRIDSFQHSTVKWPHADKSHPRVESFAKAGFYFVRRPRAPDTVRCFLCDIDLSHWKPGQSPFVRHSKESPDCAWTWLNYPELNQKPASVNPHDPSTLPRGPTMRTARIATFSKHNFWPPNKGNVTKTKKYPTASKLADAGFYFSPNSDQPARVKCAYCKVTITEPDKSINMLDKHQELSNNCTFFERTHNRATRSRRDTVDSTKSSDTFTTAKSQLEEESRNTEIPKALSTKRKLTGPKKSLDLEDITEPIRLSAAAKRRREVSNKAEEPPASTPLLKKSSEVEPITITKRKKSIEASAPPPANKPSLTKSKETKPIKITKRKNSVEQDGSANKQRKTDESENPNDDSFWDIEKTFAPPTNVRRPAITYGNKSTKQRRFPSFARGTDTSSIDIFASLKPSLIVKPGDKTKKSANGAQQTVSEKICSRKRLSTEGVKPVTEKIMKSKRFPIDAPKASNAAIRESAPTKKRALSKSSALVTTASSSPSTKAVPLKVVVELENKPSPTISSISPPATTKPQKMFTTDKIVAVEKIEPVITPTQPYKDKGKGRAVEYNLAPLPTPNPANKHISLSKSKNKAMWVTEPPMIKAAPGVTAASGSSSIKRASSSATTKLKSAVYPSLSSAVKPILTPPIIEKELSAMVMIESDFISKEDSELKSVVQPSVYPSLLSAIKPIIHPSTIEEESSAIVMIESDFISKEIEFSVPVKSRSNGNTPPPMVPQKSSSLLKPSKKKRSQSPEPTRMTSPSPADKRSPSPTHDRSRSPPRKRSRSPPHKRRGPSPLIRSPIRTSLSPDRGPSSVLRQSPIMASPCRNDLSMMSFMQSTPTEGKQHRTVSVFDLFGKCPLSPIKPISKPDHMNQFNVLQYTPVIHQSSRTRKVIMSDNEDDDDAPPRRRLSVPKSPIVMTNDTPFEDDEADLDMSAQHQTMTVQDYLEHLMEKKIEQVMKHGNKKIQIIQENSNRIKAALQQEQQK